MALTDDIRAIRNDLTEMRKENSTQHGKLFDLLRELTIQHHEVERNVALHDMQIASLRKDVDCVKKKQLGQVTRQAWTAGMWATVVGVAGILAWGVSQVISFLR